MDSLKTILEESLSSNSVFERVEALNINYLPKYLPGRDEKIRELAVQFKPVLMYPGGSFVSVVVKGPPGSGKSTTIKRFGEELVQVAKDKGIRLSFVHLNARKYKTLYLMLIETARQLKANIPNRGLSTQEVFKLLYDYLEKKNINLVLAVDEFDYFLATNPLDDVQFLLRYYDELSYETKRISYIFLLKNLAPLMQVKDHIMSVIDFPCYSSKELYDILMDRVKNEKAFREGAVDEEAIKFIAEIYGADKGGSGNARLALETLDLAGKIADSERSLVVTIDHARKASSKVNPELSIVSEVIKDLDLHEILILKALVDLEKADNIGLFPIGVVEEQYKLIAQKLGEVPRRHTQLYEYVRRLKLIGLLTTLQSDKGVKGRTTIVSLAFPITPEVESLIAKRIEELKSDRAS